MRSLHWPRARMLISLIVALGLLGVAPGARAEHEEDHRYLITGTVLGADKSPVVAKTVVVTRRGEILGAATTDSNGYYRIRLHLHDADLGSKLRVTAGDAVAEITVTLTPGDQQTQRIHKLDFTGKEFTEQAGARAGIGIPPALIYIGGIIGVVLLAGWLSNRSRKRRRATAVAARQTAKR